MLFIPLVSVGQELDHNDQKPVALEVQNFKSSGISFDKVPLFTPVTTEKRMALDEASFDVDGAVFFDYSGGASVIGRSLSTSSISIELPAARRGSSVILDLIPVDLYSGDFVSNVDVSHAAHYRGVVRGHSGSLVSLSLFADEVIGFVSMDGLTYTLGKVKGQESTHILYSETSQDWGLESTCAETEIPMGYSPRKVAHSAGMRSPGDCIRIKYEIDESLTNVIGSLAQATNYGMGVFNAQQTLYANDGINMVLSELKVWSNADPAPYVIDGYETLDSYQALTGAFNGDLAYLSFGDNFTGGVAASIGGICASNPDNSKAIGGAQGFYNGLPTYSFDVFITSHELGHLFGARHTHACVWNGNNTAIDGCAGFTEGGCQVPGNSPFAGTIMSYCSQADFGEGFHPQVAQAIQNYIASRSCTIPCGPPSCEDGIQNGDETGVDCGGPECPDCPTCDDGVQNGTETGVDCGGTDCAPCPCDGTTVTVSIDLDNYPEETSWNITSNGVTVASGGPYDNSADGSTETAVVCLDAGCFDFTILDSYGDGICCSYGNGSYTVSIPGEILASGASFSDSETTEICVDQGPEPTCDDGIQNGDETGVDCGGPECPACPSCDDGIQNGDETGVDCGGPECPACPSCDDGIQNGDETGVDCGGSDCDPCESPCTDFEVTLSIQLDNFPEETSWEITDGTTVLASGGTYGDLADGSALTEAVCLPQGCYVFTILDTYGDGICCGYGDGSYTLTSADGLLASGAEFASEESTEFCLGATASCTGDVNTDGLVDINDMLSIISVYNTNCSGCPEDINGDGFIGLEDFLMVNSVFGTSCAGSSNLGADVQEYEVQEELRASGVELPEEITKYFKSLGPVLSLYPNPVQDVLNVSIHTQSKELFQVRLVDTQGRSVEVSSLNASSGQNLLGFDTSELNGGTYFIYIESASTTSVKRFVVRK